MEIKAPMDEDDFLEEDDLYEVEPVQEKPAHLPALDGLDIVALSQVATPPLMRKAIELGLKSNNLNEVLGVLRLLSERGYGKPGKAADAATPIDAMQKVWDDLEAN